jgi:hypothetical protein
MPESLIFAQFISLLVIDFSKELADTRPEEIMAK